MKQKTIYFLTAIASLISIFLMLRFYSKKQADEKLKERFIYNIKHNVKNQLQENSNVAQLNDYNYEVFQNKRVIEISSKKEFLLKDLLSKNNLFINFWFKGCVGCELEMPELQKFYERNGQQIQFAIISNDEVETVEKYLNKNKFAMPFYVFKDDTFPVDIKVFPTSHLIVNNKTQFLYAGIGYFDNSEFYNYIDSVLVR